MQTKDLAGKYGFHDYNVIERLKDISVRGRMAYLICSFERLLLYYHCNKEEWKMVLEKLWAYTNIEYIDDWMYELAEYMPDSILEDTMSDAEYITENEFRYLYHLYSETVQDILSFLKIIFECGTCEIYSRLCNNSPGTLKKVNEAIDVLKVNGIALVDIIPFEKYEYTKHNGWGERFNGRDVSVLL